MPPPPPPHTETSEEPLAGPFKRILGSGSPTRVPPTEPRNSSFRPFTINLPKATKVAKTPLVPKALDVPMHPAPSHPTPTPKKFGAAAFAIATGSNSSPLGNHEPSLSARLNRVRGDFRGPPRSAPREPRRQSPRRAPSPPPPPPKPAFVDKEMQVYHKVSMVGEGTYGKVYKASNNLTKELVALKRIRMESEKDGVCYLSLTSREKIVLTRCSSPLPRLEK